MKHAVLATLIAVNLILLGMLLYMNTPNAYAQGGAGGDYLAVSAKSGPTDALFVLDLKSQKMLAWTLTPQGVPVLLKGTDLTRDFGLDKEDK